MKSKLISHQGAAKLERELDRLWTVERPKVTQGVADAAAEGDRSENAEYIYGKKKLREIDRKIQYLSRRLRDLEVVNIFDTRSDASKVFFGALVKVESEEGDNLVYRIVGADEVDLYDHGISVDSPVARALMGRRIGDEVLFRRPKGEIYVEIQTIDYGAGTK